MSAMPELAHNLEQPVGPIYHGTKQGKGTWADEPLIDLQKSLIPGKESEHIQTFDLSANAGESLWRTQVHDVRIDFGEAFKHIQFPETLWETSRYYTPKVFHQTYETEHHAILSLIDEGIRHLAESPRLVKDNTPVDLSTQSPSGRATLRSDLDRMYVVDERPRVLEFVATNKLRSLILQARGPLIAAFGEAPIKRLSIVQDDEGSETLFCLVGVSAGLDEARRALRSFDEQWWLDHCGEAHGKLNFAFDLI
jgi:hypothetical protein